MAWAKVLPSTKSHWEIIEILKLSWFILWFHSDLTSPFSLSVSLDRLRLARMNEEMRESEGPFGQPGQYSSSSPTEQQYKKCIQEFICLNIAEY